MNEMKETESRCEQFHQFDFFLQTSFEDFRFFCNFLFPLMFRLSPKKDSDLI